MITEDESRFLYWLAKDYFSNTGLVIDLGPLAGGSTYALALGLSENRHKFSWPLIHSYDLWEFYQDWGRFFPGKQFAHLADIQGAFLENLGSLRRWVVPHKGDICKATWTGEAIEILFIDIAKTPEAMEHIVNEFYPSLIPGKSIVVHQDFICPECPWIHATQEYLSNYFELVDSPDGGSVCFRLTQSIPKNVLGENGFYRNLRTKDGVELIRSAASRIKGWYQLCVHASLAHFYVSRSDSGKALEILNRIQNSSEYSPAIGFDISGVEGNERQIRIANYVYRVLPGMRERFGLCMRQAVQFAIKRLITALVGTHGFDRLKLEWRIGRLKNKHRVQLVIELLVSSIGQSIKASLATSLTAASPRSKCVLGSPSVVRTHDGSSLRWVNACPITTVEGSYCGFSIFRFEYKYFAIEDSAGPFDYRAFKRGEFKRCIVGHDLTEVRSCIAEVCEGREPLRSCIVLAYVPAHELRLVLDRYIPNDRLTVLTSPGKEREWQGNARFDVIPVEQGDILKWAGSLRRDVTTNKKDNFYSVIIPYIGEAVWKNNLLEVASAKLARRIEVLDPSGRRRIYQGENLRRLLYNKPYLASMFETVGVPRRKTVLEVGCSDGLVCDMVSLCGAKSVDGIDVMRTVGCQYQDMGIHYHIMDGAHLGFEDESFDLSYSIATFEHVPDPYEVMKEMLRVTKVGGCCYVQAGPLYHSPFGHHMFNYFQDYPWAHLRKDKRQLNVYLSEKGLDKAIERDLGMSSEEYLDSMLTRDHLNGLLLADYRLDEFKRRDDVKVLKFNITYEGTDLLTRQIFNEMPEFSADNLVEHGFEISFRRVK